MAYTGFNDAQPAGTDLGTAVPGEINANENALRDMIEFGQVAGVDLSISGGTNEEPTYYIFTKHGGAVLGRATMTWSSGRPTAIKWEKWNGASYDAVLSADQVLTYDGSGNLTATTYGGGLMSLLWYVIGKVKSILSTLTTHTGTSVSSGAHSAGTIAAQNANAVAITGGTIAGVSSLGYTIARGAVVSWGNVTGAKTIDWSAGDVFVGTITGNTTFSDSNLPGNAGLTNPAGSITLRLINPGAYTVTWPTAWKWPAGTAPTRTVSGTDIYEAYCDDGTTVHAAQAQRDSR